LLALTHHYGRRFAAQKRGGIILMSSLLAFQGVPRAAHYAATKAYVQTLAEGLRLELAPYTVDVLACAPGPVHSGFAERANMRMGVALKPEDIALATLSALGRRTTVRPGWLSKLLEGSLALLPRWGRVRILAQVMGGMTQHQPPVPLRQLTDGNQSS
ncbi:MAG: SDR family NAD(P)-dependent oxidoreductase, partial [Myxococcota bacterium]